MRGSSAMVIRFLRSTSLFSLTCSVLGQSTPPVRATLLRTFAVFLQLSRCVRPCVTLEGNSPKPSRPRPGATSTVLPAPTERQLSIQDLENARSSFGCSNRITTHLTAPARTSPNSPLEPLSSSSDRRGSPLVRTAPESMSASGGEGERRRNEGVEEGGDAPGALPSAPFATARPRRPREEKKPKPKNLWGPASRNLAALGRRGPTSF